MASDPATPARSEAQPSPAQHAAIGIVLPLVLLTGLVLWRALGEASFLGYNPLETQYYVPFRLEEQASGTATQKFPFGRRINEGVRLFEDVPIAGGINGRLFWLVTLSIPPLIGAVILVRRHLIRGKPWSMQSLPTLIVTAVLAVPFLAALILSLSMPPRAPYLEIAKPGFFWYPVLAGLSAVIIAYVVWMYVRDGQAVGWAWATFLGALRLSVYTVLLSVFALPALQVFETHEAHTRVLLLLDQSGSMNLIDQIVEEGVPTPPSRLDHVHGFLTGNHMEFMKNLLDKNPVVVYGFGSRLDEEFKEFRKNSRPWSVEEWRQWLRMDLKHWVLDGLSDEGKQLVRNSAGFAPEQPGTPAWAHQWLREGDIPARLGEADKARLIDRREKLLQRVALQQDIATATNYGDPVLSALTREATNMLAGIIIIGDGSSNQGSPSAYEEIRRRATNLKVPIFTVGVGEVRELINIRITDLQAPEQAPPDEAFQVRVEATGEGLADKEFDVTLEIYRPGEGKTAAHKIPAKGKFRPGGGLPQGTVEFKIDPAAPDLAAAGLVVSADRGKTEFVEGEWKFVARILKARGEAFPGDEHVSEPAAVQIIKRPLRVLLFAGGPTREYQFCRRLFVNEKDKKRAELCIYLQVTDSKGARVQDVPDNQLLTAFPNVLDTRDDPNVKPADRFYNLAMYDLIIAFDPDWTAVPRESLVLLQRWVDEYGGGLIVVGGPVNTFQLARGMNTDRLRPVIELLPVRVQDSRLAGLGIDRSTSRPWRLNFPGATQEVEFLKLDEEKKDALGGWEEFFTGRATGSGPPPAGEIPQRGFYSYYPVENVRATATVIATFTDPAARILKQDQTTDEHPYIATMKYGGGAVVWIGSGEMWRLRLYKEVYHERLWTKLGRFAAAGTLTKQGRSAGRFNIGRQYAVGSYVRFSATLRDKNLQPLDPNAHPEVRLTPPAAAAAKPQTLKLSPRREGEWRGEFEGLFQVTAPGEWELELPVPGSSEVLKTRTQGRDTNLEMDRSRPDFSLLRTKLAGTTADLRGNEALKQDLRQKLQAHLQVAGPGKKDSPPAGEDDRSHPSLFFDLKTGKIIPDYLRGELKVQRTRGPIIDLWDQGFDVTPGALQRWIAWGALAAAFLAGWLSMASLFWTSWRSLLLGSILLYALAIGVALVTAMAVGRILRVADFQVLIALAGILGIAALAVMLVRRQGIELFLPLTVTLVVLAVLWTSLAIVNYQLPQMPEHLGTVSYVLVLVVTYLSIEWLTRKLLRLA